MKLESINNDDCDSKEKGRRPSFKITIVHKNTP